MPTELTADICMNMDHADYPAMFAEAAETSRRWSLVDGPLVAAPDQGLALRSVPTIGRIINSLPHGSLGIRLQCGEIHLAVFDNRHLLPAPCMLTVGDIEVDGKREYDTTRRRLKQERLGVHRDSTESYPCHVWLTFPDLHIVDVTFFIYKFYNRVPAPFVWSDYVICSDPAHPFGADLPLKYIPMAVGRDLIWTMIAAR